MHLPRKSSCVGCFLYLIAHCCVILRRCYCRFIGISELVYWGTDQMKSSGGYSSSPSPNAIVQEIHGHGLVDWEVSSIKPPPDRSSGGSMATVCSGFVFHTGTGWPVSELIPMKTPARSLQQGDSSGHRSSPMLCFLASLWL